MADDPATPWFNDYEPELKAHITAKGFDKMDPTAALAAAVRGHAAAEKHIGVPADQLLRLPKDAADPNFQAAYDRIVGLGVPKSADEYKFDGVKFRDGSDIDEDNAKFLRDAALKYKLPAHVVRGLAADLVERAETAMDAEANDIATTKAANQVALRTHFGGHFDEKSFAAVKVAENIGFPNELLEAIATLPAPKYVQTIEALASLSSQLNEAAILRGGAPVRDPTAAYTPQQAQEELRRLSDDKEWSNKFMAGDTATLAKWQQLINIAAAGLTQRRVV